MARFRYSILNELTLGGYFVALQDQALDVPDLLNRIKSPKKDATLEAFLRLFFCYRAPSLGDGHWVQVLYEAVLDGHLEIYSEFINTPPTVRQRRGSGEDQRSRWEKSADNLGMEKWVRKFLRSKRLRVCREAVCELGYKVDVGCLGAQVYVECGDTDPKMIFDFLRSSIPIGVLPYDSEEIVWMKPNRSFRNFAKTKVPKLLG